MSKKQRLIDRIPWFRSAEADTDADVDTAAEEDAQPDGEQEPVEDSEETITVEQLVERVTASVLKKVRTQIEPMVEIIQEMDGFIRAHDEALTHLAQDDATKVKSLMEGGEYFTDLYIRSKDAQAAKKPAKDAPPAEAGGKVRQLEPGETPSGILFGHGNRG